MMAPTHDRCQDGARDLRAVTPSAVPNTPQ